MLLPGPCTHFRLQAWLRAAGEHCRKAWHDVGSLLGQESSRMADVLNLLWWWVQDADCRGDVLDIMLSTVRRGCYTPEQLRTMLQTPTESVRAWSMCACAAALACGAAAGRQLPAQQRIGCQAV